MVDILISKFYLVSTPFKYTEKNFLKIFKITYYFDFCYDIIQIQLNADKCSVI